MSLRRKNQNETNKMKTAKEILNETKAEYSDLLNDDRLCYEMTDLETSRAGSDLADLASESGHGSLKGCLNDWNAWDKKVSEVASNLIESVAMCRAHEVGHEYDDLDGFLEAAK